MAHSMEHLNQHLLCAIDCETTGVKPSWNEIVQISICPLDASLEVSKIYPVFDVWIKPEWPERISQEARYKSGTVIQKACDTGIDKFAAADLFENWFSLLGLPEKKRVVPLGFNYSAFDKGMIIDWIGWEHYNAVFDSKVRDLFVIANMMNDWADFNAMPIPFPRWMTLTAVARKLGVDVDDCRTHDSLYDCDITRQGYKKALTTFFSGGMV